jgi:hypothetical protein
MTFWNFLTYFKFCGCFINSVSHTINSSWAQHVLENFISWKQVGSEKVDGLIAHLCLFVLQFCPRQTCNVIKLGHYFSLLFYSIASLGLLRFRIPFIKSLLFSFNPWAVSQKLNLTSNTCQKITHSANSGEVCSLHSIMP